MKKIIFRKLAKDCLSFFLLIIASISLIIWVLQAVNYLDFVVEDGHGFLVYFNFTLLNFPKIVSRIFPFSLFLAFSYILLKYEDKNELIIFWNFGIKKIQFINFFIKFSLLFTIVGLIISSLIAPLAQDKARSHLRTSNLDFFENMLKPKKFIDIVKNLTIYYDKKNENNVMDNIFLQEKKNFNNYQTTFAKNGIFENREGRRILVLYDGKTINIVNGKITEFKFSKTDFNITKFSSKTIMQKKTQENSTKELFECSLILNDFKKNIENTITNCSVKNLEVIYEELYGRLIKPLYNTFIIIISLLLILRSKSDQLFYTNKIKIFVFGFVFLIFLETSSSLISTNLLSNLFISTLPFFFTLLFYFYFLIIFKIKNI